MGATKGYYSLIQYCPDRSRMESANVGVLLLCPEVGFVQARTSAGNDRIRRFFRDEPFDAQRVNAAKRAIEHRLEVDGESFRTPEDLVRFMETRGNDIVLTPPRPMKVSDPKSELDALFRELVGGRARRGRRAVEIPALDQEFRKPSFQNRILFGQRVEVPMLGRMLTVPYAFRNGVLNLVKPQRFASDEKTATLTAMRLAIEGDLLSRYPEQEEQRKLIVVSAFDESVSLADLPNRVEAVLREYQVRVVLEDRVAEFAREVEQQAH